METFEWTRVSWPDAARAFFSPQSVQCPVDRWQGDCEPPSTVRCVEVFQQPFFLNTYLQLAGFCVCVCVCICLVSHLPRTNPMANRSSGGGPNSSNSWRSGARVAEETGSPARRLQPQLSKHCACSLRWMRACPARRTPLWIGTDVGKYWVTLPHPQQIIRVIKMTQTLVLDFAVSMIIKTRDLKKKNLIKANDGALILLNIWQVKPIRHIHQILSTKFW